MSPICRLRLDLAPGERVANLSGDPSIRRLDAAKTRFKIRAKRRDRGWLSHKRPDFSRGPRRFGAKTRRSVVHPSGQHLSRARSVVHPSGQHLSRATAAVPQPGQHRAVPRETVSETRTASRRGPATVCTGRHDREIPKDVHRRSGTAAYRPSAALLPSRPHPSRGPARLHPAVTDCDPTLCRSGFHIS